ncbi:hypothetical protein T06_119, partial [Trichinella sp. T6]
LDVDAILDCNPHADDCIPDNDIVYKMEKKNALKRRAAEEMKTVPQIYHEEARSVSADLETAGQFPTYKSVKTKTGTKISKTSANSPVAGDSTTLRMTTSGRHFLFHNNKIMLSDHSVWLPELRFVTPVRCCIRDLLHLYYCVGKFLRSVSKLMTCT